MWAAVAAVTGHGVGGGGGHGAAGRPSREAAGQGLQEVTKRGKMVSLATIRDVCAVMYTSVLAETWR